LRLRQSVVGPPLLAVRFEFATAHTGRQEYLLHQQQKYDPDLTSP
jgi:hypothetical protein